MLTNATAATAVRVKLVDAKIIALGWNPDNNEDLQLIEQGVSAYVSSAHSEGFAPREMLQDVLDKYKSFFGACGDVDAVSTPDRTTIVFYLRARTGR